MRRTSLLFVTASLLVHGGLFGSGAWLAKRAARANQETPKVAFAGETFEIATDERVRETQRTDEVEPEKQTTREDGVTTKRAAHLATRGDPASTEGHAVEVPLTYGALGDRSALEVSVAISRGFPQAASTDPVWRTVAFGDAGSAILEIELDEDGSLARWSLGAGASPALRQAFVRTMAFIGGRAFLARARTTKLRVTAHVTTDAVRDGADAVYAIHSEHDGPSASAYFSLSSGRRIDVTITEMSPR